MSTTTPDEFDALRTIVKTLEAFGADGELSAEMRNR